MNNEKKFDEKKFQAMLQLAEFGAKRLEERRSVEFRIFISYMTLLILALYQLVKQGNPTHEFLELFIQKDSISLELWEGITLYIFALLIHFIYFTWQIGICVAMDNDSHRRNFYLKEAEDISGYPLNYSDPNKEIVIFKHYLQQFLHLKVIWADWSRMLLVAIPTILFIIVIDLFIKKSNWGINIQTRILLWFIPILIFVVIRVILVPVVVWIVERIKKNGSEKPDIDETKSRANS